MEPKRNNREPEVRTEGWVFDGFILCVNDVGSEMVENPFVGTLTDTRTGKLVGEPIFGKYFFRVMGMLNIRLNQILMDEFQAGR